MHDEQRPEGQEPDAWTIWSAQRDQAEQQAPGQPSPQSGQPAQPSDAPGSYGSLPPPPPPPPSYGQAGQPGAFGRPGAYGQPGAHTQPIGYAQAGGYGEPGYGQFPGYGQPGYPQRRRRAGRLANTLAYIAVAAVAAVAGGVVEAVVTHNGTPSANSGLNNGVQNGNNSPFSGSGQGTNLGGNPNISNATVRQVQNAVVPGLVVISSNLKYQGDAAEATGMVISGNGLVLTNNHVINQTTGLTATVVATGQRFTARWIGYDKSADIAVIQLVGASHLHTVPIGNSAGVHVGQGVIAMGNADGSGSITTVTGSVTGLNKSIIASDDGTGDSEQLTNMIETNSHIIPGDSGGPLANVDGQVIGMDTAASTNTNGYGQQNVGFAIPINRAMTIARQIIGGQSSSSVRVGSVGFLGVLVTGSKNNQQSALTSPRAQLNQQVRNDEANGISPYNGQGSTGCVSDSGNQGVPSRIAPVQRGTLVLGALCGTPASQVGMIPGDVITKVNGHAVSSPASLVGILAALRSGQTVSVTWVTPSDQTVRQLMTLAAAPPT